MTKTKRKPKLTDAGAMMLRAMAEGRDPYSHIYGQGQSAHGGATATMGALHRHGWIGKDGEVTDAGREALAAYDARP